MDKLKKGDVVTIFGIGDFMAQTTKSTLKATGMMHNDKPVFVENKKGARKKFTLRPFKNDNLVFLGDVPFTTDADVVLGGENGGFTSRVVRGNACLNLAGDAEVIKDWVLNKNINPEFNKLDAVIHIEGEKETLLFPEVQTSHAVVERMRDKGMIING